MSKLTGDGGASPSSRELAAQAWCKPTTSHKVMDPELAESFAEILDEKTCMSKPFESFKECLKTCKEFEFGPEITAEQCWNEGYKLGRSRWHWGPSWMVTVRGWINTQIDKLKGL